MAHWLFKTEPTEYSFENLKKDGTTSWTGIRNFQARNFLKTAKLGDAIILYHTGKEKSAVGLATVSENPMPEIDPKTPGDWVQLKISAKSALKNPVTITAMKSHPKLKSLLLFKQSRLSVIPLSELEYNSILELSTSPPK